MPAPAENREVAIASTHVAMAFPLARRTTFRAGGCPGRARELRGFTGDAGRGWRGVWPRLEGRGDSRRCVEYCGDWCDGGATGEKWFVGWRENDWDDLVGQLRR